MDYQEIFSLNALQEATKDFEKMKGAKLTEENWKKLRAQVLEFSKSINKLIESIEDRHKHSNQIRELEGIKTMTETIIKELNNPKICQAIKVIPDMASDDKQPEEKKE